MTTAEPLALRRLTEPGLDAFGAYLDQLKADPKLAPPTYLLTDPTTSQPAADVEIDPSRTFPRRLEAARYLDEILTTAALPAVERDHGLWAWLTLLFFDQVCPTGKGGARKPKARVVYIPAVADFQRYYRHALLGPYTVLRANGEENALALLLSPVHIMTDIVEQLASRQGRITNPTVVGTATRLYVDRDALTYKPGARGSGDGSPRRLTAVLDQLDLTYDLYGTTVEELVSLLPKEFSRFVVMASADADGEDE